MYFVYILVSALTRKTYVGWTTSIDRRLAEHNSGKSIYTSKYIPWKIFYKEEYKTREEAIAREKYLKTAAGRRFIKKLFISS